MKSFLFHLGDSRKGPIGFSARVHARTRKQALANLQKALEKLNQEVDIDTGHEQVEYLTVYFNKSAVSLEDIDDVRDESKNHGN